MDNFKTILSPNDLAIQFPISQSIKDKIIQTRKEIEKIIKGEDDRLLVIVGPCSIHLPDEALEYAHMLKEFADRHKNYLLIVMRVYFEKPRTNIGWKGLIHDPDLDGSCDLNKGLHVTRKLLLNLNEIGIPCACEMLDLLSPMYLEDLISWCCIGARTCESQPHRQMTSGLNMPVGFKNGTTGSVKIAIDAILACREKHSYLGINHAGQISIINTSGNPYGHVVLRGGWDGPTIKPNYYMEDIQHVVQLLQYAGINDKQVVVVDCSHGNSMKKYQNQPLVVRYLTEHISKGNTNVIGVMLESNINEGRQELLSINNNTDIDTIQQPQLKHGVSITDACINISTTEEVLEELAISVKNRRKII